MYLRPQSAIAQLPGYGAKPVSAAPAGLGAVSGRGLGKRIAVPHLMKLRGGRAVVIPGLGDFASDLAAGIQSGNGVGSSLPASLRYSAPAPQTVSAVFGLNFSQTDLTLESHMQQFTAINTSMAMSPSSVGVSDPSQWPALCAVEANSYCSSFSTPPPDCAQQASIAAKYGQILQTAWSYFPASVWQAAKAVNGALVAPQTDPTYFFGAPSWAVQVLSANGSGPSMSSAPPPPVITPAGAAPAVIAVSSSPGAIATFSGNAGAAPSPIVPPAYSTPSAPAPAGGATSFTTVPMYGSPSANNPNLYTATAPYWGVNPAPGAAPAAPSPSGSGFDLSGFLSSGLTIGSYTIPYWAIGGGLLALLLLGGGSRR